MFQEHGWLDDPASYHDVPPPLTDVALRKARSGTIRYTVMSFDSGYSPHEGEPGHERWLADRENQTVYVWMLRHPEPRPWIICVHGAAMGQAGSDLRVFRAAWLHTVLGLNVALPIQPRHGPRRAGLPIGVGFPNHDLMDTVHAVTQSAWDIRRLIGWIRDAGHEQHRRTGTVARRLHSRVARQHRSGSVMRDPRCPSRRLRDVDGIPRRIAFSRRRRASHGSPSLRRSCTASFRLSRSSRRSHITAGSSTQALPTSSSTRSIRSARSPATGKNPTSIGSRAATSASSCRGPCTSSSSARCGRRTCFRRPFPMTTRQSPSAFHVPSYAHAGLRACRATRSELEAPAADERGVDKPTYVPAHGVADMTAGIPVDVRSVPVVPQRRYLLDESTKRSTRSIIECRPARLLSSCRTVMACSSATANFGQ